MREHARDRLASQDLAAVCEKDSRGGGGWGYVRPYGLVCVCVQRRY